MILIFIQGHRQQKILHCFLTSFLIDLNEIWYATIIWWPVQAHVEFFRKIYIQGWELYTFSFIKNVFNIGLHFDTYKPICFECGIMMDMTKLHILIPVSMTLTSTQGHSVARA